MSRGISGTKVRIPAAGIGTAHLDLGYEKVTGRSLDVQSEFEKGVKS